MYKFLILIAVFFLSITSTYGQDKKIKLLSEGFYFDPLVFDPTESLTSAGIFNLWENKEDVTGIYIPVNIALSQSLIRYKIDSLAGWEFGLQAAAFTQFEIKHVGDGTYLGGMINVDYRVTGFVSYRKKDFSLRLRLFHISSHLADDYIIRNDITTPTPNTLNYEQVDLTLSQDLGFFRPYAGLGYIFTPNSIRERFSVEIGGQFRQQNREDNFFRWIAGIDVKFFEQNSYTPGYRLGAGVEMGQTYKTHIALLLDYYNGHLPYSTLEYRKVSWLGISGLILPKYRKQ